tara:strand:+ start:577 stop:1215 length:639 start_codon:yes stop_codon:yes gene_type:complete
MRDSLVFNFIDVEQNSDEWFALRSGRLTSSKLGVVMANYGKAFGEPAKKYAVNIAIEQITGEPIPSSFTNAHMERGHEQEPMARALYEELTFSDVTNGGFFDCGFIGCSPDGMVGHDGAIEIKSVIASVQFANVKRGKVDPAYYWQCVGNLKFTGRKWLDFVSYSAEFPIDRQLFVYRIHAADLADEFENIDLRVCEFKKLVEQSKEIILNS